MITITLIFLILFLCGYYFFSIIGVRLLRKNDELDFLSEDVIGAYSSISYVLASAILIAIILELILIQR